MQYQWYECKKCKNQGYTNGIPDPWFKGGCAPDGPAGAHEWEVIGTWDTDTSKYPNSNCEITKK